MSGRFINQSECSSPLPPAIDLTYNERMTFVILYVAITPVTLAFNGFLIFALIKTKEYRSKFPRYILALASTDFCTGFFLQPLLVYFFAVSRKVKEICALSWYIMLSAYFLLNLSALLIFCISADRFSTMRVSITQLNSSGIKRTNLFIASAVCLSMSMTIGVVISAMTNTFCYFQSIVLCGNLLVACCILLLYVKTISTVRRKRSRIRVETVIEQDKSGERKGSRPKVAYDKRMTRTISVILMSLLITYPAYIVFSLLRSFDAALHERCEERSTLYLLEVYSTFFLLYVNSISNACLYSFNNRKIRDVFIKMMFSKTVGQNTTKRFRRNEVIEMK